jgi:hypothetical protein
MSRRGGSPRARSATHPPEPSPEPRLARFDSRVLVVCGALLLLLILGTLLKLHGSSIAVWNRIVPGRSQLQGTLLGTPKVIRMDEWGMITPAMLSQARHRPPFPVANPSWGPERAPLVMNFPVRHWSLAFRPQYWGFFLLDVERAFSFYWTMKAVFLLGGVFLLAMLLTRHDLAASLLIAAWVYFSGFVQWWYSTPAMMPEMIGCWALAVASAHYLACGRRRWVIAISALVMAAGTVGFLLCCYPPFQVPLIYLGIALLVGSLLPHLREARPDLAIRVCCLTVALVICAGAIALFYHDTRSTVELMWHTVYPGVRRSAGGDVTIARLFGGFFGFFTTAGARAWVNVCEDSNFLLLFPVPMAALAVRVVRHRRIHPLEWSLLAYCALLLSWMLIGWPSVCASLSGFGLTHDTRPLLGLGLASILWCGVFLSDRSQALVLGRLGSGILSGAFALLGVLLGLGIDRETGGFAGGPRIALVCVFVGAASYLLLRRNMRGFAIVLLAPSVLCWGLVNPLSTGLDPILSTNLFQQTSRIVEKDPAARWIVYGKYFLAAYIQATGANVFNGAKVTPPLDDFRVLDPEGTAISVYNRYAHISLAPQPDSALVFSPEGDAAYTMCVDPKNDCWRRIAIRYAALPFRSTDPGFLRTADLVLPLPDDGVWIYRYRWSVPGPLDSAAKGRASSRPE